jgi:hypothetical protein
MPFPTLRPCLSITISGYRVHGRDQQRVHHPRPEAEEGDQREEPEPEQVGDLHLRPMLQRHHHDGSSLQRDSILVGSGEGLLPS